MLFVLQFLFGLVFWLLQQQALPGLPTVQGDWCLLGPRMTVPSRACISVAWSVPVQNLNT